MVLRLKFMSFHILGRTSLMWASLSGQMTSAATLIDAGADINHADGSGMTSLDHAVTFIDDEDVLEGEGMFNFLTNIYFVLT